MNFCILSVSMFLLSVAGYAQTADEIIEKYVNAIGGKETLGKINSLYMENSIEVMGNEGPSTTVILNGKELKVFPILWDKKMVQCYTDKGGWVVNPWLEAAIQLKCLLISTIPESLRFILPIL
ncbi:MAG: hypothetical protein HC905_16080 [Bacteroidales bacterium]|nr:hypothetical protein [Bacteroidales bacterium]